MFSFQKMSLASQVSSSSSGIIGSSMGDREYRSDGQPLLAGTWWVAGRHSRREIRARSSSGHELPG